MEVKIKLNKFSIYFFLNYYIEYPNWMFQDNYSIPICNFLTSWIIFYKAHIFIIT
jgi:hypothetical protein